MPAASRTDRSSDDDVPGCDGRRDPPRSGLRHSIRRHHDGLWLAHELSHDGSRVVSRILARPGPAACFEASVRDRTPAARGPDGRRALPRVHGQRRREPSRRSTRPPGSPMTDEASAAQIAMRTSPPTPAARTARSSTTSARISGPSPAGPPQGLRLLLSIEVSDVRKRSEIGRARSNRRLEAGRASCADVRPMPQRTRKERSSEIPRGCHDAHVRALQREGCSTCRADGPGARFAHAPPSRRCPAIQVAPATDELPLLHPSASGTRPQRDRHVRLARRANRRQSFGQHVRDLVGMAIHVSVGLPHPVEEAMRPCLRRCRRRAPSRPRCQTGAGQSPGPSGRDHGNTATARPGCPARSSRLTKSRTRT